jgi:hypothetical protein
VTQLEAVRASGPCARFVEGSWTGEVLTAAAQSGRYLVDALIARRLDPFMLGVGRCLRAQ